MRVLIASKIEPILDLLSMRDQDLKIKSSLKRIRVDTRTRKRIYVETAQSPFAIAALCIFLPVLSSHLNSEIAGYRFINAKWYKKITQWVIHRSSVLHSLGVRKLMLFESGGKVKPLHDIKLLGTFSKRDLLNFEYRGVHIGDLVYDTYLNETRQATINLNDPELLKLLMDCCSHVDSWVQLIQQDKVAAICVGHAVYKNGIPARVCIKYEIPVYQVNLNSIYSLRPERPLAHFDFLDYRENFKLLPQELKAQALELGMHRLNQRLKLGVSPELSYLPVSAYLPIEGDEERVLKDTNKFKVLIATHDFFDSPHCNGNTIYEDFYEWLYAVAELSMKTDYEWYVKNHPFLRGEGEVVVKELISRYPNIIWIPPETSHQQIIKEGINAVLTVYGTIGSEYALMGLKVVNACVTNPHCKYSFNFNPSNIEEFEKLILTLDFASIRINNEDIYEYYYMHYLHYGASWAFHDSKFQEICKYSYDPNNHEIYSYLSWYLEKIGLAGISAEILRAIKINKYRLDSVITRP